VDLEDIQELSFHRVPPVLFSLIHFNVLNFISVFGGVSYIGFVETNRLLRTVSLLMLMFNILHQVLRRANDASQNVRVLFKLVEIG